MAINLKKSLKNIIHESTWLSPAAKYVLNQKVLALRSFFSIPGRLSSGQQVEHFYKELVIGSDYVENEVHFRRHQQKYAIRKFASGKNPSSLIAPIRDSAVYSYRYNILNIPALNLMYPLFAKGVPAYVNYGMTGNIIAHEMGHALDKTGILLTEKYEMPLFKKDMQIEYDKRVECFVKQLENISDKEHLNTPEEEESSDDLWGSEFRNEDDSIKQKPDLGGFITTSEYIADAIGLETAFKAYEKMKEDKHFVEEQKIPPLETLTDEQMFFISFAGSHCESVTSKYLQHKAQFKDSPNATGKSRVNLAVSNSKAFATAFSCSKGKLMNPELKCSIWNKSEDGSEENPMNIIDQLLDMD